jgi:hypothetical protein
MAASPKNSTRPPRPRLPLFTGQIITKADLPAPAEHVWQITLVGILDVGLAQGWQYSAFPAGEIRDLHVAAKLKAMGLKPGWPDLIFVNPDGIFHGLELKSRAAYRRRDNGLSDAQRSFRDHAMACSWQWAVAGDLDDALAVLRSWGALRSKEGRVT